MQSGPLSYQTGFNPALLMQAARLHGMHGCTACRAEGPDHQHHLMQQVEQQVAVQLQLAGMQLLRYKDYILMHDTLGDSLDNTKTNRNSWTMAGSQGSTLL